LHPSKLHQLADGVSENRKNIPCKAAPKSGRA
jgi:hypothetical protein